MSMALAVPVLGWVASPIFSKLITKGFSYVGMNVPDELTELETVILPKISLAIKAMPRGLDVPELTRWQQRLQDASYEAEDLLDEVEYQRVKRHNRELPVRITSQPIIKALVKICNKVETQCSILSPQKRKLWRWLTEFNDTVKKLVKDTITFRELLPNVPQNSNTLNTTAPTVAVTSSLPLNKVFGRDEDRDRLVKLLMEEPVDASSEWNKSVIAIVGRGGAGKTTLAQYVFHDERVVEYFDMKIWICLTRKLDIMEHTKQMIESATNKACSIQSNLEALHSTLREILLGSKHILLVLDDIWYNNNNNNRVQINEDWERLMAPFTSIGKCSILLTSRSKELPAGLPTTCVIELEDLKQDELVSLFKYHSNLDKISDPNLQQNLKEIGAQIVAKLGGSPLATKAVASRLRTQWDVKKWEDALEGDTLSDTTEALLWSFQQLEEPLQKCFLYCARLPKGWGFGRGWLVRELRVLNFIQCKDSTREVNDIGEQYFEELIGNCFFEPTTNETNGELLYRIHDNFHDLADRLSRGYCYRIEDDKVMEIPSTVRHLTIDFSTIKQVAPSISKLKNLRSLVILKTLEEDSSGVLKEILVNSKKLRLLSVHFNGTQVLPNIVFRLKYLKLLSIPSAVINQLPESLSKLYLLEFLLISDSVKSIPRYMSNLINLRDFLVCDKKNKKIVHAFFLIRNLAKMTSLQQLPGFRASKERGYEIQQLGELRQLEGKLRITGLENVEHADEASKARLREKTKLKSLELVWTPSLIKRYSDLQVIGALQPPSNLVHLTIDGYAGARYPVWFANSSFHELRSIILNRCNALRELYHLPENLIKLEIYMCPNLVFVSENDLHCNQQPVLLDKQLVITKIALFLERASDSIYLWKEVLNAEGTSFKQIFIGSGREFPEIQVLESGLESNTSSFGIDQLEVWWHCHRERINFNYNSNVLENQLPSLSNLRALTLSSCNITDGAFSNCLINLNSLEELCLRGIMSLTTLPSEEILENLKCLRVLKIISCWLLRSLGALGALPSLQKLFMMCCPCLDTENGNNSSSGLPSSLQSLEIFLCSIPSGILASNMPHLNAIDFQDCLSASTLPIGHLSSLRKFELYNCRDICLLEGFHLLSNLEEVRLSKIPKLDVRRSLPESWPGCRELHIGDMQMLEILFSSDNLFAPAELILEYFEEEAITFDFEGANLHQLTSVEYLYFFRCRTCKSLPTSLRTKFPSLKNIAFKECPEISSLPELPESVTGLSIVGCPVLKERCCNNGEDWQKIANIPWRYIP